MSDLPAVLAAGKLRGVVSLGHSIKGALVGASRLLFRLPERETSTLAGPVGRPSNARCAF